MASKTTLSDEGGAFEAREWLRKQVVGKSVRFETRKQGGGAGDRIYGWLFLDSTDGSAPVHLAIECVRQGYATPKATKYPEKSTENGGEEANPDDYESQLLKAYKEAEEAKRGIHAPVPIVRTTKNAGEDFAVLSLVDACQKLATQKRITCVIEYCFDGSRFRCQVTDSQLAGYQYASFTLLLAGATSPRIGNPKADPPMPTEPFAHEARNFVTNRLLQRELQISLVGTDKNGLNAVGTIHHPVGNIAVELLKAGYARMAEWTVRLMPAAEVPPLRVAENNAKRTGVGLWHSYAPPVLSSASQIRGTVIEVISGDTVLILPDGKSYVSDENLLKISLASIRAPRVGSALAGRADEPFSVECKDRLRVLTVGKPVEAQTHYEREIPIRPGENETRAFATISSGKNADVAEVLINEGLASTQQHRDDDEKSPRFDELRAAEAAAKAAKKGIHREGEYKKGAVNDLTDPRKAKAYSGSLMRAGTIKAVVDYVFNGALFKLFIPAENCYIRFSPNFIRCPQPSPSIGSKQPGKLAEPFGDEAKFHARLNVLQRQVEVVCSGVTPGGIIIGSMYTGFGSQRTDYTIDLLGAGYATVDQRKIDYNEAPKNLVDAQMVAKGNKVGLWSLEQPATQEATSKPGEKFADIVVKARLSEIRSGSHFFYHVVDDEALAVMDKSMQKFTETNGISGAPCDVKVGKVVAALFDDGTGKKWYRAKVIERKGTVKATVLFVDFGNIATISTASQMRPLDMSLVTDRIPPIAKEAVLALTNTRPIENEHGTDAARLLQAECWGRDVTINCFAPNEDGKMAVSLVSTGSDKTVNEQLLLEGLARVGNVNAVAALSSRMINNNAIVQLAADLNVAEQASRRSRNGMWRYGDVGDEDPDEL